MNNGPARVEYTLNVTLQKGKATPVVFSKTGYGSDQAEAEADARRQLNEDSYYKMLKGAGAEEI